MYCGVLQRRKGALNMCLEDSQKSALHPLHVVKRVVKCVAR